MSGRHRKPTTSAISVAQIAFTGAVVGGSGIALAGQAGAATDGMRPGRQLRIRMMQMLARHLPALGVPRFIERMTIAPVRLSVHV